MKTQNLWLASLSLLILCNGCGLLPKEAELPRAPVVHEVEDVEHAVTTVMRGDIIVSKNVACQYKPARVESLAFSVSGEYIRGFFVQPGDAVEPGDLLGELVMDDLQEQKAEQDWQLKKLELKSMLLKIYLPSLQKIPQHFFLILSLNKKLLHTLKLKLI